MIPLSSSAELKEAFAFKVKGLAYDTDMHTCNINIHVSASCRAYLSEGYFMLSQYIYTLTWRALELISYVGQLVETDEAIKLSTIGPTNPCLPTINGDILNSSACKKQV